MQARAHRPSRAAIGGRYHKPGCTLNITQTGLRVFHLEHLAAVNIFKQQRKVQGGWTSQATSYEKPKEGVSAYQARPSCPAAASSRARPPWRCWTSLVQTPAASSPPCAAPGAGPPAARAAEAPCQMLLGIRRPYKCPARARRWPLLLPQTLIFASCITNFSSFHFVTLHLRHSCRVASWQRPDGSPSAVLQACGSVAGS